MFGKKTPEKTLPEDRVSLKPLFGVRPGVYLFIFYSLGILVILFFVLIYPGLSNPGSIALLRSEPSGAAVRVDGVYLGTTPCDVFIPRGKRKIEMVLPGFEPYAIQRDIPGRVFGSLIFPVREDIRGSLPTGDPLGALALGAAEYAAWSFAGEPTEAYQIPLSLSEAAYRSGPAAVDPEVHAGMDALLTGAARFSVTKAAARDLLRAKYLIDNGGLSPSPVTLIRSASDMAAYLARTPGAAAWIGRLLPQETASAITGSAWYTRELPAPPSPASGPAFGGKLDLASLSFREVPAGTVTREAGFPHVTGVGRFWISQTEVSTGIWEDFIRDRPEWAPENTGKLLEQGLAGDDYLGGIDHPAYPHPTVPGVSWYAARAFCEWLTGMLPPSMDSYEVRLPTEAEWEYAAKIPGGFLENMNGGLWEWCADFFAPLNFLPAPEEARELISSPERSLRGGSWVNTPRSVGIETRASLPPGSCSPFVSFRPVIAGKGTLSP
ncbi:MAG: SUMF1/EgtB/PvdO family nonheme iron enzyme [Spirochaetaceae bacterium]|jgi:hypothetical protein|nr:SUMF1/EgtB/PvdO family nonheme iron enzyme [Spirochaetaceae bacterium]